MATPNYAFEKRRRDQEKKAKKEQKRLSKLEAKAAGSTEDGEDAGKSETGDDEVSVTPE